jgi:hypothetical protein
MIELFKLIVEAVTKAIPNISTMRRDKELREIGSDLFLLYVRLNETLICAEEIVNSMEMYVQRMTKHLQQGDDEYALTGGEWIAYKVEQQRLNLARVGRIMQRCAVQLQIVDAETYSSIVPLLKGKFNALDSLLTQMAQGAITIAGPTESEFRELLTSRPDAFSPDFREMEQYRELAGRVRAGSVSTQVPWDKQIYGIIVEYLNTRKPREQLQLIRNALGEMRTALERNFSIADIMLAVGDKKLDADYEGDYFW